MASQVTNIILNEKMTAQNSRQQQQDKTENLRAHEADRGYA